MGVFHVQLVQRQLYVCRGCVYPHQTAASAQLERAFAIDYCLLLLHRFVSQPVWFDVLHGLSKPTAASGIALIAQCTVVNSLCLVVVFGRVHTAIRSPALCD